MSGLYNVVFGQDDNALQLVALLESVQGFDVGRFRDAWVETDGGRLLIRVHTRNGGGNREDCDDGSMQDHPWYERDEDNDYDPTYADYWFVVDLTAIPPEVGRALVEIAKPPVDVAARWRAVIEAMERGS